MNDLRREILSQVASGSITAEEGAARLAGLESEPAPASPARAVKLIRIVARFGNTEVIGDPSVTYAVAEGPHGVRQDGETMVIDQSPMSEETIFTFSRPRIRMSIPGFEADRKLIVRMNPSIALTASVQAGNLSIEGVQGAVTGDIKAGNCHISEFRGPIDLNVMAGNITASGRLDGGTSGLWPDVGGATRTSAGSGGCSARRG